jgi:hypothetical protein
LSPANHPEANISLIIIINVERFVVNVIRLNINTNTIERLFPEDSTVLKIFKINFNNNNNNNNNNLIQLFIYLRAELNTQLSITESAKIKTTALRQHRTKETKTNRT